MSAHYNPNTLRTKLQISIDGGGGGGGGGEPSLPSDSAELPELSAPSVDEASEGSKLSSKR